VPLRRLASLVGRATLDRESQLRIGASLLALTAVLALAGLAPAGGAHAARSSAAGRSRAAWRRVIGWPASCESGWRESGLGGPGVTVVAVAGEELAIVECYFGAYQGTQLLYVLKDGRKLAGPLTALTYDIQAGGRLTPTVATQILGLLSFNPHTRSLTVFDLLRGLGDCGLYSTFHLSGIRLVPTSVRARPTCAGGASAGGASVSPSRWPRVSVPRLSIR